MDHYRKHHSHRKHREHHCHWHRCTVSVPPNMWGCHTHWRKLPRGIRDMILKEYVSGQENDIALVSNRYLIVAAAAETYSVAWEVTYASAPANP